MTSSVEAISGGAFISFRLVWQNSSYTVGCVNNVNERSSTISYYDWGGGNTIAGGLYDHQRLTSESEFHFYNSGAAVAEWAGIAAEWYGYELGGDSEQVEEMVSIQERPRVHPAWGSRGRVDVGGFSGK
jgi:hypothetical protein